MLKILRKYYAIIGSNVSIDDKRKVLQNQNVCKESELIINRKEDGSTVQFEVIDYI